MGAGDLTSLNTYRYAHSDSITGVSTAHTSQLFATCSRDKSLNIWDIRLAQPVIDYSETNAYALTAIVWTTAAQANETIFYGDDGGNIYSIDLRCLTEPLATIKAFDSPVHKIKFRKKLFGTLGNTNQIRVYDSTPQMPQIVYENSDALDYVRDFVWNTDESLHSVGWDSQVRTHIIK